MIRAHIRGVVGIVKWSYYNAAAIHGYAVTRDANKRTWSLRAQLVPGAIDRFKMAQRPLVFVAPHATGQWRWPIVEFDVQNHVMTAQLGAVEE